MDQNKGKDGVELKNLENMLAPWKNIIPRDPARIDQILSLMLLYWKKNPDLRLGQIIENIANRSGSHTFYMEDDIVTNFLTKQLEESKT